MSIRVLHIDAEYGWRGGQQQVVYLHEGLHDRGWPTTLACQPKSDLWNYCRGHELPCAAVRMRNEVDLLAAYRIARHCRRMGVQVIHAHAAHAHAIALWVKWFHPSLRFISTRRVDFSIRHTIFSRLKYTHKSVDRIVCISDLVRRVLVADGVSPHRLTTIHSGVDTGKHAHIGKMGTFKAELGIPTDHLLVGTIAAVVGHKDYPNLLRAARHVIDGNDKVSFCAVGDGDQWDAAQQLHRELDLAGRFVFAGYRRDVGRFLKNFDLFVLASREEGLGTSLLDAQAAGLPVVATRAGGIPEVVTDGRNGRLVPARDARALADAVLQLAADTAFRQRLGDQARQDVARFAVENTVDAYLKLYSELLTPHA
ncbi:MAG: glycosyltransferase [Desulfosarcinaceae bacterium]|nr:glycosyltransferase [Desulfosarcinaceae bacterium]